MTLVVLAWAAISVALIWPIAVAVIGSMTLGEPDPIDWGLCLTLATLLATLWPIAFAPLASWLLWQRINRPVEDRTPEATR